MLFGFWYCVSKDCRSRGKENRVRYLIGVRAEENTSDGTETDGEIVDVMEKDIGQPKESGQRLEKSMERLTMMMADLMVRRRARQCHR